MHSCARCCVPLGTDYHAHSRCQTPVWRRVSPKAVLLGLELPSGAQHRACVPHHHTDRVHTLGASVAARGVASDARGHQRTSRARFAEAGRKAQRTR